MPRERLSFSTLGKCWRTRIRRQLNWDCLTYSVDAQAAASNFSRFTLSMFIPSKRGNSVDSVRAGECRAPSL